MQTVLLFESVPAIIGLMYACTNIGDHRPTVKNFILLFCLPFFSLQMFIWIIIAGLFYMSGHTLFCAACVVWIIISLSIVARAEDILAGRV